MTRDKGHQPRSIIFKPYLKTKWHEQTTADILEEQKMPEGSIIIIISTAFLNINPNCS